MSYTYTNGDGLSVIDKTTPNGATEPVSNLDDAVRQVKAYLKDSVAGVAKILADVTTNSADIATLSTSATDFDGRLTSDEAAILAAQNAITALQAVTTASKFIVIVENSSQDVNMDGADHVLQFSSEIADADGVFDSSTYTFTATVAGAYHVDCYIQIDVNTADPTTWEASLRVLKNGAIGLIVGESALNPPGQRLYPDVGGLVTLSIGDTIKVALNMAGSGGGAVTASNGRLSIFRV